jgi:inosine/xanthosine triphosphate pyrophosphatase family protein
MSFLKKVDKSAVFEKISVYTYEASNWNYMLSSLCAVLIAALADDSDLLSDALNMLPSLLSVQQLHQSY